MQPTGNTYDPQERIPAMLVLFALGMTVAIIRDPAMFAGLGR